MSLAKVETAANPVAWTLGLCWLAALAEGFDIQSMGVAAPGLSPALSLSRAQLGPVFSASLLGLMFGALALGRLADRFGRKRVLIFSMATFAVFSAATALVWDLNSLLVIRVLAGLGLGGAMPNLVALSSEAVPEDRRARVVTFVSIGFPIGGMLVSGLAAIGTWRDIFWVGGAAPAVVAPLMVLALPESPRFLAARRAAPGSRESYARVLFGTGRGATTALLWAAAFTAVLSLYLLLNWLPTLMGDKGVGKSGASLVALLFNLGGAAGLLALAPLLDGGRRALILAGWYLALGVSLLTLAAAGPSLASAGPAGFIAGLFVVSASACLYGLAACYYPVAIRGAGVGASVAVGRIGAIAGPLLASALLSAGLGASGVLLALLPLAAVAGAATIALVAHPAVTDQSSIGT